MADVMAHRDLEIITAAILTAGQQAGAGGNRADRTVSDFWDVLEEVRKQNVLLRATDHPQARRPS